MAGAGLIACGNSVELVTPTPRSAFRSTYPCELLTRSTAQRLLAVEGLRRIGAQSFDTGEEQCIWARGRYKGIPQVGLLVSPSERIYGTQTFTSLQQRSRKERASGYRALDGLGDRAFLTSPGRMESSVFVAHGGRSFVLTMRLKIKPRTQPPPLAKLESTARTIFARFIRPRG